MLKKTELNFTTRTTVQRALWQSTDTGARGGKRADGGDPNPTDPTSAAGEEGIPVVDKIHPDGHPQRNLQIIRRTLVPQTEAQDDAD